MNNKKGIEFSFAWLFALLVGAFILFAAIYGAMKFIDSGRDTQQTKAAKEISIIFNPLETGLASGKLTSVSLNTETRIYNRCSASGSFGNQKFSVSQKSFGKWPPEGGAIPIYNKYIFSENVTEGKKFYFFSKPFDMPFKVSEIIFMTTKEYCFLNAPEFIKDEIKDLNLKNVKTENCTSTDIDVCFGQGNCRIMVYGECSGICDSEAGEYEFGHTMKNGQKEYYIGSLIYGSIFSAPEIYNCNFKRLMLRLEQISYLYENEAKSLVSIGCGDVITLNLAQLAEAAKSAENSSSGAILNLRESAEKVDDQNLAQSGCGIY